MLTIQGVGFDAYFYHVTTRLTKQQLGEFSIDNLEKVLLADNPMTRLCKKHDILFKLEDGISVYYQGKRKIFDKPMEARIRNRLDKVNDSCVNGFLLPELMDDSYIGLTGMPEIFSDIMVSLNRRDIQQEYYEKKTCYLATVSTKTEKMIFDGAEPMMSSQEKTQKIIRYLLCYIGYKKIFSASYVTNPMVRLEDNYCVPADEIVDIREIHDWKETFERQFLVLTRVFEYTKVKDKEKKEVICMSPAQQILDYRKEIDDNQKQVREMVMESYRDIAAGKGRDYNEFFDELEKRYSDVKV